LKISVRLRWRLAIKSWIIIILVTDKRLDQKLPKRAITVLLQVTGWSWLS
jgi:hypothetical protein